MFKLIDIKKEEWTVFLWSFAYFFFLLCAYYILRPIRDEMAIQNGIKNIPWLYTAVFFGMLVVTPLFGLVSSRWPRRTFLPVVYLFFISNLLMFYAALQSQVFSVKDIAATFYIWLSVFNYFIVSVFWSFMTDVFNAGRAKRLFAGIAAGGSIGAMAGPAITAELVKEIGIANLLLVSSVMLGCAIVCIAAIGNWAKRNKAPGDPRLEDEPLGGSLLGGIKLMFASPYLMVIAAYLIISQTLGNFFYLEQLRLIHEFTASPEEQTQLLARLDLVVNVTTLVVEVFITSALVRKLGMVFCLTLLPAIGVVTLGITGLVPTLLTVSICTVLRRATEFAVSKPAREILFTVVTREERYKAKNVIDTVVARGGDVLGSWGLNGLRLLGLGTGGMAFAAMPFAMLMLVTGVYLGRAQQKRQDAMPAPTSATPAAAD